MLTNLPLDHGDPLREALYQAARKHRGCIPGVVTSVDSPAGSTVSVQPAIVEMVVDQNGILQPTELPLLTTVPLATFGVAGFALTWPLSAGDEGLLLFQDASIDVAWQNGGTKAAQVELRRHDISDAIFLPLRWTKPSQLASASATSAQLRNLAGDTVIDLADGQVTVTAGSVKLGSGTLQTLVTNAWLTYWTGTVMPALSAHGITVAAPPANSVTTNTEAS
jgi:hypothetical protein